MSYVNYDFVLDHINSYPGELVAQQVEGWTCLAQILTLGVGSGGRATYTTRITDPPTPQTQQHLTYKQGLTGMFTGNQPRTAA